MFYDYIFIILLPSYYFSQQCLQAPPHRESEDDSEGDDIGDIYEYETLTVHNVTWKNWEDSIDIDARGVIRKSAPDITAGNAQYLTPMGFLKLFLPIEYIESEILRATNESMGEGVKEFTIGEFWTWLGLWIIISQYPGHPYRVFFSTREGLLFPSSLSWNHHVM